MPVPSLPAGSHCGLGSVQPQECDKGSFSASAQQASCTACQPGYYQNSTGATSCYPCARGHWCTADTPIPCSENTYNANPLAHLVTNCTRCPERTTTLGVSGASGIDACRCQKSFYLSPEGRDTSSDPACVDRCCTCPIGTDCSAGAILLERLPINPGYFRLSSDAIDVRRCPDAAAGCSGASTCRESTSGCRGGDDPTNPCLDGLAGTFCRQCSNESFYYIPAEESKGAHCAACEDAVANGFGSAMLLFLVGLGLASLGCAAAARFYRGSRGAKYRRYVKVAVYEYKILNKLKILIGEQ